MVGARGAITAALLSAAFAAAGCCSLKGVGTSSRFNRDTPEGAFDFVRSAFAEDRTLDQYDSFHPDFREVQGISRGKYRLARTLRPGIFENAARLVGEASLVSVEPGAGPAETSKGPRNWARVTLRTSEGRGVFILVDDPAWHLVTDDADLGAVAGPVEDIDRAVRVEGDQLVVEFRTRLPFPPEPGARVRRLELHHDWLLYSIEELEGFDAFLKEVQETEEEAAAKETPQ